ncbi:MAG: crossover junction endodeoxyribonuclease RuvC [Elusimicrobia bacterium]|nr:crossover junction endodeoxyribonuclease RuvC [Elusimicrobiota bacterium]
MITLGIDPGLADTGWAVVDSSPGETPRLVSSGVVQTPAAAGLPDRLGFIYRRISEILSSHRADSVAVEEMFFLKAAHSVRASLQARGVILLAAAQSGMPVAEYNPRQVKSTLTGSGAASKGQMQKMIQRLLALREPLRPDDVADAAAIALCHLRAGRMKGLRVLDRIGSRSPAPAAPLRETTRP